MAELCATCHKARRNLYKSPYLVTWLGESKDIKKRPATCVVCPKLVAWLQAWKVVKPKRLSTLEASRVMEDMLRYADVSATDVNSGERIVHESSTWRIVPIDNAEPPSFTEDVKSNSDEEVEEIIPQRELSISQAFHLEVVDKHFVLGGQKIRKTDETPTRVSVYDLVNAISGNDPRHSNTYFTRMCGAYPEVRTACVDFKFPGQGQRPTPVTDARGMVMIINMLPGPRAAQFRVSTAELLVRYLGGDKTLIEEINSNAELQASASDSNIVSIFGEAVRTANVKSITNLVVPPRTPGVYLVNCSNPDTRKFVFDSPIPEGKDVIGYGYSAVSMYSRVEAQMAETGDYKFLDCFETPHASALEQRLKDYIKFTGLGTIKATFTEPNGKKKTKTEFFLADTEEYIPVFPYMTHAIGLLEATNDAGAKRSHELAMEEEKTKQVQAEAESKARQVEADCKARQTEAEAESAAAIEKERTRQKEIELEMMRLQIEMKK